MRPTRSLRFHSARWSLTQRQGHRIAGANVSNILPWLISLVFAQCALSVTVVKDRRSCLRIWTRASKHASQFAAGNSCFLVAPFRLCQDHNMKHLLLACLFPMTLTAQTMQQLTEQVGKTVLFRD